MSALANLQSRLAELIDAYGVPGASVAVLAGGRVSEAAAGTSNLNTGQAVETHTLFQIGSITKLYTAALAEQLIDEGRFSLGMTVRELIPGFEVADPAVSETLTLRHCLTHTNGVDGDFFIDAGRGEDRVAKFVGLLTDLPQLHAPGAMFSYSNVGFVIAGRMIEIAGGEIWDKAIRRRIAKPLGTPSFSTLPEQAIRHACAVGHLGTPGDLFVTPVAYLAQSNGPAGSTPMARASDVIAFAAMLLNRGRTADGTQLLSERAVAEMESLQVPCPEGVVPDAFGVATMQYDWAGSGHPSVFGHDGSTIGQASWMRYHPESGTAVALLTNGGNGRAVYRALFTELFQELAGIAPPPALVAAPGLKLDTTPYLGSYGRSLERIDIVEEEGGLVAHHTPAAEAAAVNGVRRFALQPASEHVFVGHQEGMTEPQTYSFLDWSEGRPERVHFGVRVHVRDFPEAP